MKFCGYQNVIFITLFLYPFFLSLHTNFNNLRNQNTKKKKKKVGTCSFYYWHFLASLTCFESTVWHWYLNWRLSVALSFWRWCNMKNNSKLLFLFCLQCEHRHENMNLPCVICTFPRPTFLSVFNRSLKMSTSWILHCELEIHKSSCSALDNI